MSNATGRAAIGGSAVNRRSAIGCEQKSSSTDKTNAMGSGNLNTRSAESIIYDVLMYSVQFLYTVQWKHMLHILYTYRVFDLNKNILIKTVKNSINCHIRIK